MNNTLLAEQIQQKWAPVLDHADLPKIELDTARETNTEIEQELDAEAQVMIEQLGGTNETSD